MNSRLRTVLLAVAILSVTLAPKFVVSRATLNTTDDARQKVAAIRSFVIQNGVRDPVSVLPSRSASQWVGWRILEPGCQAIAFPDLGDGDMTEVLHSVRTSHTTTAFIYRGSIFASYPRFWIATDKAMARVTWAVHKDHWNKPLLVILFYSGSDCSRVLAWNWATLWS